MPASERDPVAVAELAQVHHGRVPRGGRRLRGRGSAGAHAACDLRGGQRVAAAASRSSSGRRRPGTGVIAAAFGLTASKSTSPTRPSSVRLMPDVDHDRALLDHVGVDQLRHADRGDQHVGAAALGGEVARARVAVGDRRVLRPAAAPPSACRRASSGRRRPRSRRSARRPRTRSSSITPSGVHGTMPGLALLEQAGVHRRQPVDVLERVDQRASSRRRRSAAAPAAGAGCRGPSRRRSATSISSATSSCGVSAGSSWWNERMPGLLGRLALVAHVDVRRRVVADEDRRQAGLVAAARRSTRRPRARRAP